MNETEGRIREVALRLFGQKGFQATSTREIAAEAGLTVAGLYYYVGTKEELLVDIMLGTSGTLLNSALRIGASSTIAEQKLVWLVLLHVWFHGEHALESSVINTELRSLSGEAHSRALKVRDRYEAIWREAIAQGVATGVFQIQDAKLGAIALIEMGRGVSHWYRSQGDLTLTEICYMHADWALALLRAARNGQLIRVSDLERVEPQRLYLTEEGEKN